MAGLELMKKMKLLDQGQDHFHSMVKMHLSILLDLSTDDCDCTFLDGEKQEKEIRKKKSFTPIKPKKPKGVMEGAPLTSEGACQVYQIIKFLGRENNISVEGLFRKHGNIKKQSALKERLNRGVSLDLDEGEFSVHECAAVLKNFLASLPQPLLTDAYYSAHCQVPLLLREEMTVEEKMRIRIKQISALQLLFQLIPEVNYNLLKDLLMFLNRVSKYEKENKMSSSNLGTLFSTHILCPRKLSAETLQSNHQLLTKAVTFMIDQAENLFCLPPQLIVDIENFLSNRSSAGCQTPLAKSRKLHLNCAAASGRRNDRADSPIVNTIFTFIDREATQVATAQSSTDQALAELYAHVQSMPESAHKKRLVSKLNEANGKGTPDASLRTRSRRKSGDGLMNLLTPRRKRPAHGSYSFQQSLAVVATPPAPSFRRQTSLKPGPGPATDQKLLSPSYSSPAVLSPNRDRMPSPCTSTPQSRSSASTASPHSQVSEPVDAIDEVDTPGKDSAGPEDDESDEDLDGSYSVPPLPPRTPCPSLDRQSTGSITPTILSCKSTTPPSTPAPTPFMSVMSPLTAASEKNPAMKTPRSRQPVMVYSSKNLDQIPFGLIDKDSSQKMFGCSEPESPCVPTEYNEDEPDEASIIPATIVASSTHEDNTKENNDLNNDNTKENSDLNVKRAKNAVYHDKSLSSDFKEYMTRHGLVLSNDNSELEESLNADNSVSENNKSFSEEVRRLLKEDEKLSTSLQAALDGEELDAFGESSSLLHSPVKVLNNSNSTFQQFSSSSTLKEEEVSYQSSSQECESPDENNIQSFTANSRKGRKRRSITEIAKTNPLTIRDMNSKNIYFETDL